MGKQADAYRPPAPQPMTPIRSLLRVIREGEGNLLSLVPIDAYRKPVTHLGYSRRSILLINDPELAREMLTDPLEIFPKNDLMVGALEPLVGDSIFVSSGATLAPPARHDRPGVLAYAHQPGVCRPWSAAVDDYEQALDRARAAARCFRWTTR